MEVKQDAVLEEECLRFVLRCRIDGENSAP